MGRFHPAQNSFVAGELSPRLEGRDDLPQYLQGMRLAENGIVLPHGGYTRRPGSAFVAEVKDSSVFTRLIPFQFNVEQAYMVEFGNLYARFYVNQGQLEDSPSVPHEVVTPYLTAELAELRWAQSNDILFVGHPDNAVYQLNRTSATTFTFTKTSFTVPPLRPTNIDTAKTVAISSTGTLATAAGFTFDEVLDVGRVIMVVDSLGGTPPAPDIVHEYYTITAVAVGGVTATISKLIRVDRTGLSATAPQDTIAATDEFALGFFSDAEGPHDITFHEGRLCFGGTDTHPDRFVMSVSDDFLNFSLANPDLENADNADRAISRRVSGAGSPNIRWMASADEQLFIGSAGQEFTVRGANEDLITPTGTVVKPLTNRGSNAIAPVIVDAQVLFVSGRKIREMIFDERNGGFRARDITILAEHILNEGVDEIAYQQDPDSIIWVVRSDGQLVGFTFEREQEVIGAHRHILGGTGAEVESIGVIPTPDLTEDQLWMIVKRTIDGGTKRYVEYIDKTYRPDVDSTSTDAELVAAVAEGRFLDSFLTYSGASTTTLTGLDHLEGETVSVLADGSVHPDVTVSSGSVTLERAVTAAVVGLKYTTKGQTQRFLARPGLGAALGSGMGQKHKIKRVIVFLYNTLGLNIGSNPQNRTDIVQFRSGSDLMDNSPPLVHTDFIDVAMPDPGSGWSRNPTVYFTQDQPLPMTILAIAPDDEVNEK